MSAAGARVYHVAEGITGGGLYLGSDGEDRWSLTAAAAIAVGLNMNRGDVIYHPKEVADPRVQWLARRPPRP